MATDQPKQSLHGDRARAESFGAIAVDYDRYRTSYPDALIADLVDLAPQRALDVACGTGKVAVPLLACGVSVLGVEADPKMAAVARTHGVIVEVAPFEGWDDDGRRFSLITCGQGWHWIDPAAGPAKAARVLVPGGTLALFWSFPEMDPALERKMDDVHVEHAPELTRRRDNSAYADDVRAAGVFASVEERTYRWSRLFTSEEWAHRASTFSDYQQLPPDRRAILLDALRAVVDSEGGSINVPFATYTIYARTADR